MTLLYAAGVPDVVAQIFPNLPNFIAHVLATIVMIVLLAKMVYKPFRNAIDVRRGKINELLDEAVDKQAKADHEEREAASLLNDAKSKSLVIVKNAKADANAQRTKILNDATLEVANMQTQAKNAIMRAHVEAEDQVKQTIIDVAFQAAQQILEQDVNSEKNKQLVNDFINNLDNQTKEVN